jgi:putative flippase GtrA
VQLAFYSIAGGLAAALNLVVFLVMLGSGAPVTASVVTAFTLAAAMNYVLSVALIFRHRARYPAALEFAIFLVMAAGIGWVDLIATTRALDARYAPVAAKLIASAIILLLNFGVRRYIIFPQRAGSGWRPQNPARGE